MEYLFELVRHLFYFMKCIHFSFLMIRNKNLKPIIKSKVCERWIVLEAVLDELWAKWYVAITQECVVLVHQKNADLGRPKSHCIRRLWDIL